MTINGVQGGGGGGGGGVIGNMSRGDSHLNAWGKKA